MIYTTGVCAVCNSELIHEFPSDYPNRFKFCCLCLNITKILFGVEGKMSKENFDLHIRYCPSCSERIKMKEKMLKLITLVG